MEITLFTINNSRTELNLAISNATAATTLYLWTDKTYKDYSKAIDLSAKLNGIATQNIVITLNELKQKYFDGLYFVELSSSAELDSSFTGDLTRYKECILDKIVSLSMCDSCLNKESGAIINAQGLLTSLETAIELGFLDESFNIITALNKYCSNECKSCGGYKNQPSGNYYSLPIDNSESDGDNQNIQVFSVDVSSLVRNNQTLIIYEGGVSKYEISINSISNLNDRFPIKLDINKVITSSLVGGISPAIRIMDNISYNNYSLTGSGLNLTTDNPYNKDFSYYEVNNLYEFLSLSHGYNLILVLDVS